MKKNFKFIIAIMLTISMMFLLTGCTEKKTSAEECGKAFYTATVKQDKELISDYTIVDKSEYEDMFNVEILDIKEALIEQIKNFGIIIPEEKLEQYFDAYLNMIKKSECKNVTVLSEDDNVAELEFEVSSVDVIAIFADSVEEIESKYFEKYKNGEITEDNYEKFQQEYVLDCIDMYIEKFNNYEPSLNTKFKYKFKKKVVQNNIFIKNEIWAPKGVAAFGMQSALAAIGFESIADLKNLLNSGYIDDEYADYDEDLNGYKYDEDSNYSLDGFETEKAVEQ